MANTKQAIKRTRQNDKTRARQKGQASSVRTAMAKVVAAVAENAENKTELLKDANKAIDKAASKGLIHKNKASREKSRLTKLVNQN